MKKLLLASCMLLGLFFLVSCEPTIETPTVSIEPDTLSMLVHEVDTLSVLVSNGNLSGTTTWESNNTKIVTVDLHGKITAKSEGEAIITATTNLGSAQCLVVVTSGILTMNMERVECNLYEVYQLTVTKPEHKKTARVTWKSSNADIASVDKNGNVTALASGTADITAEVSGCQTAKCTFVVQNIDYAYSRKFLIEHFTGDACGYCPYGMYSIVEHIAQSETPYIWVSHHDGFNHDEYTIAESKNICNLLDVQGAPSMSHNRTKQTKGLTFHPGYLPELTITDNSKAAMYVEINHTYNAVSRQMEIIVSGESTFSTENQFLLSVLIKENRLVGQQADYYYALDPYAGWKEYMHARVVRDFLTLPLGDTIKFEDKKFSKTFSHTIEDKWIAENCCIVAYLTPLTGQPIINAEQVALVEGTNGGEEYNPYGITDATGPQKVVTFNGIQVAKVEGENILEIMLVSNSVLSTAYGNAQPIGLVYINTEAETLETGTYPIQTDEAIGSITAGYRIDEKASFGGSILIYALSDYLTNGQLAAAHLWRMNNGEMVVDENGNITFNFTTYNGTPVNSNYTVTNTNEANLTPQKSRSKEVKLVRRTMNQLKIY